LALEERIARIEGILEQMDKRLSRLENEVSHLREEMNNRFDLLNGRIDSLFKWLVGLIIAMWTTIMCTLIPILLKLLGVI